MAKEVLNLVSNTIERLNISEPIKILSDVALRELNPFHAVIVCDDIISTRVLIDMCSRIVNGSILHDSMVISRGNSKLRKRIQYHKYYKVGYKTVLIVKCDTKHSDNASVLGYDNIKIEFIGLNARKYAIKMVKRIYNLNNTWCNSGRLILRMYDSEKGSFGGFSVQSLDMNRIVLREEKSKLLSESLDTFVKAKDIYSDFQLGYRYGILLHGEPGTGKSSLIRAIATELSVKYKLAASLYELDLSLSVDTLRRLITELNSEQTLYKSEKDRLMIIYIEELDRLFPGKRHSGTIDSEYEAKYNMLLQLLDGVNSPGGVLFIATTNHIDVLDDALIREGRFDLKLHLEKFDEDTAKEYCNRLGVSYRLLDGVSYPLSPAYLQQKVIKYKIKGE